jgi:hypothetical protein
LLQNLLDKSRKPFAIGMLGIAEKESVR